MAILQFTAEGKLKEKEIKLDLLKGGFLLPFKQLVFFLIPLLIIIFIKNYLGLFIAINLIVVYLIVLPASIMVLSYSYSLLDAINPFTIFSLISRIGWSYAIMYLFLIFLNGGTSTAFYLISDHVYGSFIIFFELFFQIYFSFVMYAMMGYVLFQFHKKIGYATYNDMEQVSEEDELTLLESMIDEDNIHGAREILKNMIKEEPDNLNLRKKFHKLTKALKDDKQLIFHGRGLIERLINANQADEAVSVYLDCLKVKPDFELESDKYYFPIAERMRAKKHYKEAIQLINGFHKKYKDNESTPFLYLLAAKILIEDLSDYNKAESILSYIKINYPQHIVEKDVETYSNILKKL